MKLLFLALALMMGLVVSVLLVINRKEAAPVRFNVKDFPEHGISLILPSDASLAVPGAKPAKSKSGLIGESYSVVLKNTGSRAVVGYRIKWECVDSKGEISERDASNIISWIFLHAEESDHRMALGRAQEIIKPNSIWLIPFDSPARPLEGNVDETSFDAAEVNKNSATDTIEECRSLTVIADGIFFDDGTFIGPDTTNFFTEVKTQMDARYGLLLEIQNELKDGKKVEEVFRRLETIRDQPGARLGESPSSNEFYAFFRRLFAEDVLGKKELWGSDKTIEDINLLLSRPWIPLRKL